MRSNDHRNSDQHPDAAKGDQRHAHRFSIFHTDEHDLAIGFDVPEKRSNANGVEQRELRRKS
jgi:hypothetical protein